MIAKRCTKTQYYRTIDIFLQHFHWNVDHNVGNYSPSPTFITQNNKLSYSCTNVKQTEDCESKSQACESNQKSPVQSVPAEYNAIIHSFKLTDFGSLRLQTTRCESATAKHVKARQAVIQCLDFLYLILPITDRRFSFRLAWS